MMQEWVEGGAADGFNVMPSVFPSGLQDFVEMILPELQRRGLKKKEYRGPTLRDHLDLRLPKRKFAD